MKPYILSIDNNDIARIRKAAHKFGVEEGKKIGVAMELENSTPMITELTQEIIALKKEIKTLRNATI